MEQGLGALNYRDNRTDSNINTSGFIGIEEENELMDDGNLMKEEHDTHGFIGDDI